MQKTKAKLLIKEPMINQNENDDDGKFVIRDQDMMQYCNDPLSAKGR